MRPARRRPPPRPRWPRGSTRPRRSGRGGRPTSRPAPAAPSRRRSSASPKSAARTGRRPPGRAFRARLRDRSGRRSATRRWRWSTGARLVALLADCIAPDGTGLRQATRIAGLLGSLWRQAGPGSPRFAGWGWPGVDPAVADRLPVAGRHRITARKRVLSERRNPRPLAGAGRARPAAGRTGWCWR